MLDLIEEAFSLDSDDDNDDNNDDSDNKILSSQGII
jgi:hypothetical protein